MTIQNNITNHYFFVNKLFIGEPNDAKQFYLYCFYSHLIGIYPTTISILIEFLAYFFID